MGEAAEFFARGVVNELELQKQIMGEQQRNLEAQLKEMKGEHTKDRDTYESKLRAANLEKAELSAIESSLRETIERLNQDRNELERELQTKMDQERQERKREVDEWKGKVGVNEQQMSDMQRRVYAVESEKEKEKALLEQKVEFLERTIADY